MHEYQKKRLTESAFCKSMILKGMFLGVLEELEQKWQPRKKKSGSKAAALQKEFSTSSIIQKG
jgi:hypothetical protein